MMGHELATLDYEPSALAFELHNSKAIAGKELSLSSWCIASLCIASSEKYSGSIDDGTRTRKPSVINRVL